MPSRPKYDGLPRPSKRDCRGSTGSAAHRTSSPVGVVIPLALVLALVNPNAGADEPAKSVERLALEVDNANGLRAARQPQRFLGARSCAASACHGGIDPDPRFPLSRRNEYVHWLDRDPHSRSYQTLQNELSKAILQRLSRSTDDDTTRANRLANCFGCHNPQPAKSQQAATFYERDAVGCEICHGPAEQWIGPHVTQSWPRLKRTGDAKALGFIETEDIKIRVQICAECHVGSPAREVNHDLIAAGHPALKFELTAYYAMLPKHWRDERERRSNPQLEIELWQAGQVACGEAAIELLKWRSKRAADEPPAGVWPEFAEYDCYACHHDLVHPSWRQTSPTRNVPLGMPAWGSWYYARLKQPADENLRALATLMQHSFRPDPKAIIDAAKLVQLATPPIRADTKLPTDWDDAAQRYLALVATEQAQRDSGMTVDDELTAAITSLREQLAFPLGYDSPKGLFERRDTSVTRDQIHESLFDLMNQLQRRGDQ